MSGRERVGGVVKGKRKRALARDSHDEDGVTAVIMTDSGYQANCR
jgi:hypothetical protein